MFPFVLFAHPHLFIDLKLNIICKGDTIERVDVSWYFDEMNSQMLIMDYDKDFNGKFSKKEIKNFKKEVFDTLKPMSYYTHLKIKKKQENIKKLIDSFSLDLKNNRFIVKYGLNLKKYKNYENLTLGFWDEDFFNSFVMDKEWIKINNCKLKYNIKDIDGDFFMGQALEIYR